MAKTLLTVSEEKAIAKTYKAGKVTQQELAYEYGVAPITIRRALAEQGLIKLVGYRTRKQSALLNKLESMGITSVEQLDAIISKTAA